MKYPRSAREAFKMLTGDWRKYPIDHERQLSHNTSLVVTPDDLDDSHTISVRLYGTRIVTWPGPFSYEGPPPPYALASEYAGWLYDAVYDQPPIVILDSGGWRTPTTKRRMNQCLPHRYHVYQHGYEWFVHDYFTDTSQPFEDGMFLEAHK